MKVGPSRWPTLGSPVANPGFAVNQPVFGLVISTIEHLARDVNDCPTAKLSLNVLTRMVSTWGGPDIVPQAQAVGSGHTVNGAGKPRLEGFDHFMITRFSPLCWAMPSNADFDFRDAQGKQVLGEAAALQKAIYAKTGQQYLTYLRDVELMGMGMDNATMDEYLNAVCNMDTKGFQQYYKVYLFGLLLRCCVTNLESRILYKRTLGDIGSLLNSLIFSERCMPGAGTKRVPS